MDSKLQELITKLTTIGFGKGISIEDACKKLKKADLVQIIKDQQETLVHLDTRVKGSVNFVKCLEMPAFNKAKALFAKRF